MYNFVSMFRLRGSGWVCISTMGRIPRVRALLCPYLDIFFLRKMFIAENFLGFLPIYNMTHISYILVLVHNPSPLQSLIKEKASHVDSGEPVNEEMLKCCMWSKEIFEKLKDIFERLSHPASHLLALLKGLNCLLRKLSLWAALVSFVVEYEVWGLRNAEKQSLKTSTS